MIKTMGIRNFKCFLNATISFNNLTVFLGANAVGKSTVIQALLLIRQVIDRIIKNNLTIKNNFDIVLNDDYFLNLGNSSEVLSNNADNEEIQFALSNDGVRLIFTYLVSKDDPKLTITLKDIEPNDFDLENTSLSICHNRFYYLNTERIGPRSIQNMQNQEFTHTGYRGEYTAHAVAKSSEDKVDLPRRFRSSEYIVPNLNKQVEYWLDYIISGAELLTTEYKNINIVGLTLRTKDSNTPFLNPNNVGFGISYVLPIIVNGLVAKPGSIFIIENPEVHLHPSGQSRIGQFLAQVASSGVQVIIETHSEHVINGIRLALLKNILKSQHINFNFFDIGNEGIQVENIHLNDFAEINKWPKGFLDQEQQDIRQMIQLRKEMRKKL